MKTNNLNRWSELSINNKTLRNRVVIPPMASATADQQGFITPETINHYQRLMEARPGILLVEYTYVHPTGRSEVNQLGIQSDAHIEGLSKISQLIRKSGAMAGIQLTHAGGKTKRELTDGFLMGPSAIAVPVKGQDLAIPDSMNRDEIEMWKSAFIAASDRAVAAGFDLIEIHSAHGYGLNQWLSPITNQRVDKYGKNTNGRMLLLLEIVDAIRIKHPKLLISVRMPGQDFVEEGLTISDTIAIAQSLEKVGVDILHVSSGIGGWKRSSTRTGEGYLVDEAAQIQTAVRVPVIGVGGIQTGEYIDQGIFSGQFSLAAVGRAILEDPRGWKEYNLSTNK
jgi:NADPH2 dehydrogenase